MINTAPQYLLRTSLDTREYAKENGWLCIAAGPDELFLDLDTPESAIRFDSLWGLFLLLFPKSVISRRTKSKSGVGEHVVITLAFPLPDDRKIALQASLGSDGKREMLSLSRVISGDPDPILFFEMPS